MLVLAFLLASELPQTSLTVTNDRSSLCHRVDEDYRRYLDEQRNELEKRTIYFNLLMWPCEDDGIFQAKWFSEALAILNEPSFALGTNAKGYSDRLRLLAFSHTGAGYIIRLDYPSYGRAVLTFAEGEWFTKPEGHQHRRPERRLKQKWSREIARAEAASFLAEVDQANVLSSRFVPEVFETPSKGDARAQADAQPDVRYQDICISFATAVLERLDKNGRHTVAQTGCGRSDAIYPLIDRLHSFIGVEPLTLEPREKPGTN